ncbi:MAG: RtcB family protein, partial [Bacilli bacterium]|nr:RtcB family protein [Bacilli bacterium]
MEAILSSPAVSGRKIALMPDCHANGNGTLTGFTMTGGDSVILGLEEGAGCGVTSFRLDAKKEDIDFPRLDDVCHEIPAGKGEGYVEPAYPYDFSVLRCYEAIKRAYIWPVCLGSLGGGNHFIELDEGEAGALYLIVHNGLGLLSSPAWDFYLNKALKSAGKTKENATLSDTEIRGKDKEDFLFDMAFFVRLCSYNRFYMGEYIAKKMGWKILDSIDICHHYQSERDGIIRHGAVSAHKGEKVVIPVNAKEGCIMGVGKGNPDWNYSAPHGGGRLYSRKKAVEAFAFEQYQDLMQGVYTSSVKEGNLDEIPLAYRKLNDIVEAIQDSVEVTEILRPLF